MKYEHFMWTTKPIKFILSSNKHELKSKKKVWHTDNHSGARCAWGLFRRREDENKNPEKNVGRIDAKLIGLTGNGKQYEISHKIEMLL